MVQLEFVSARQLGRFRAGSKGDTIRHATANPKGRAPEACQWAQFAQLAQEIEVLSRLPLRYAPDLGVAEGVHRHRAAQGVKRIG